MVIDCTPKILEQVVVFNVLEAMIAAALDKPLDEITEDDLLEVISEQRMDARVIYPQGEFRRVIQHKRLIFVVNVYSRYRSKRCFETCNRKVLTSSLISLQRQLVESLCTYSY